MNVTESLMRAGTFRGELQASAPYSVLSELDQACGWTGDTSSYTPNDGHIIVTKVWVEPTLVDPDLAFYTGRLETVVGNRFEGSGIGAWIGAGGVPANIKTVAVTTNQDADAWVTAYVAASPNGITKGSVTADATTYGADWEMVRIVEHLDKMCSALGFEWKLNPDFTLDVDTATNLFTSDAVMVTDHTEGVSGTIRGINGSIVGWTIDASNRTSQVVAVDGTATLRTASSSGTVAYDIDGSAAVMQRLIDAPGTGSAEATSIAQSTINLMEDPRFGFEVFATGRVRDHVTPGDTIYVYRPPRVQDVNSAVVMFRGQPTFPVSVRVQQVRWAVTEGYGVYLYRNDGTVTVTDLTPYMVWPDDGTWLTVGTGPEPVAAATSSTGIFGGAQGGAVASGISRYDREAVTRVV